MKIDLTSCKTAEDVERAMKPLGDTLAAIRGAAERHGFSLETSDEPAARAYRDGRLMGALLVVAQAARLHLACNGRAGLTALSGALHDLSEAERAAGVDLTSASVDEMRARRKRDRTAAKRRKARR